jgi:hypothetical protein
MRVLLVVVCLFLTALAGLAGCDGCGKGKATDAMQRKGSMKAPEDSDCAKKSGKCVAREDQRDCKDSFYSHACADLGSDQPICCVQAQ